MHFIGINYKKIKNAPAMILVTFIVILISGFMISNGMGLFNAKRTQAVQNKYSGGYFGINIHFVKPDEKELDLIDECGFELVRMDMFWNKIEKERGVYDFSQYDQLVNSLTKRGIGALFILDYGNKLYDNGLAPFTSEGRSAFANFARACVERYKGRGFIWEIWNEPNNAFWQPKPDAVNYAKLFEAASKQIREADAGAMIAGPAISGFEWDFLRGLAAMKVFDEVDIFTVHPYRTRIPETVTEDFLYARELLHEYTGRKELQTASGEWGYSSAYKGMDEKLQTRYLTRMFLTNIMNGAVFSIWYDWKDDGTNPKSVEHHFGVIYRDLSKKSAFIAAQTLIKEIGQFDYKCRLDIGNKEDYALLFTKGKKQVIALWTTGAAHEVNINENVKQANIVDMMGNRYIQSVPDKKLKIILKQEPQYIELEQDGLNR